MSTTLSVAREKSVAYSPYSIKKDDLELFYNDVKSGFLVNNDAGNSFKKSVTLTPRIPQNLKTWVDTMTAKCITLAQELTKGGGSPTTDYYDIKPALTAVENFGHVNKDLWFITEVKKFWAYTGYIKNGVKEREQRYVYDFGFILNFDNTKIGSGSDPDKNGSKNSVEFILPEGDSTKSTFDGYKTGSETYDDVVKNISAIINGSSSVIKKSLEVKQKYKRTRAVTEPTTDCFGNIYKGNPSLGNAWSQFLILFLRISGEGSVDLKEIHFDLKYFKDVLFGNLTTSKSKDFDLTYYADLSEILKDNKFFDESSSVVFSKKQTLSIEKIGATSYPEITLPLANDSAYFYYNTTPENVDSIIKWEVNSNGSITTYKPGETLTKIQNDLTITPIYKYKLKINVLGNIPHKGHPDYPNFKSQYENSDLVGVDDYYQVMKWKDGIEKDKVFHIYDPKIVGWEFKGWKLADGTIETSLSSDTKFNPSKHQNITAIWEGKKYVIGYYILVPTEKITNDDVLVNDYKKETFHFNNKSYKVVRSFDQNNQEHEGVGNEYQSGTDYNLWSLKGLEYWSKGFNLKDKNLYVLDKDPDSTWVEDPENPYEMSQPISKADGSTFTYGSVRLGYIVDPIEYKIICNPPEVINSDKGFTGVDYRQEIEDRTFTILDYIDSDIYLNEIYSDTSGTKYPIKRGYELDHNVIKTKSGNLVKGEIKPYRVLEDIYVTSYYKVEKYILRFYDYCSDSYEYIPFTYNDLVTTSGSNLILEKYFPEKFKAPLVSNEDYYTFTGWSNSKLGKFCDNKLNKTNNDEYFYIDNTGTYLRPWANLDKEKATTISLVSDWDRNCGLEIFKNGEFNHPFNWIRGGDDTEPRFNPDKLNPDNPYEFFDFIKVYDGEDKAWHQAIQIKIYDEDETWHDINIKAPEPPNSTEYQEI